MEALVIFLLVLLAIVVLALSRKRSPTDEQMENRYRAYDKWYHSDEE